MPPKRPAEQSDHPAKRLRTSLPGHKSFSLAPLPIVVGDESNGLAQTFYAHLDVLNKHSEFFAIAINKGWKESEEKRVKLPDHDPETFEIFLGFIYHGEMRTRSQTDGAPECDQEWVRLAQCWSLGEKLLCTSFKDAVTDAIIDKIREKNYFPIGLHDVVYRDTATPNALSHLLVDIAIWSWPTSRLQEKAVDSTKCSDFWRDIAIRLHDVSKNYPGHPAPYIQPSCTYHEHIREQTPCYKTMFMIGRAGQ